MPTTGGRTLTFRRKKPQPEARKELDLAAALPSSDDFRTSLLMPNLSARFSMLRDQDDPTTKIGKANDDSVLYPKRASRLDLFGPDGLSDIAEVTSIAGSLRPAFPYGRAESHASFDGDGTDDDASIGGSVMGRAKPGQGNKFFGGRQKIYKIPVGGSTSARDLHTGDRGMGRAVYDDDVAISEFQALKRDVHPHPSRHAEFPAVADERPFARDEDVSRSSPLHGHATYDGETSSSTASGPSDARISTAATSVASSFNGYTQSNPAVSGYATTAATATTAAAKPSPTGDERQATKNKRMYSPGLDQQLYDQHSSAMSRLESIQRQRVQGGIALPRGAIPSSRSATNLHDRYHRSGALYASSSFRAGSPPPSAPATGLGGFDLGLSDDGPPSARREDEPPFGRSPPLSPPVSPGWAADASLSPFVAALEPNDRGKATASGAFNKPRTQYDDQQYAQRQRQLAEGRETPPPARTPSRAEVTPDGNGGRLRNDSSASVQSNQSSLRLQPLPPSTTERVLDMVPEASAAHGIPWASHPPPPSDRSYLPPVSRSASSQGNTASDRIPSPDLFSSKPATPTLYLPAAAPAEAAPTNKSSRYAYDDEHPAFLHQPVTEAAEDEHSHAIHQNIVITSPRSKRDLTIYTGQANDDPIGPNLTPVAHNDTGLSGLIQAHLRTASDQSSIYPSSPQPGATFSTEIPTTESSGHRDDGYTANLMEKRKQWSGESIGLAVSDGPATAPTLIPLSVRAQQIREQAVQLKNASKPAAPTGGLAGSDGGPNGAGTASRQDSPESGNLPWSEPVQGHHHIRAASTETQQERHDFATELADRRRMVQDNLKSLVVEPDSRSASPIPGSRTRDNSPGRSGGPLGLFKKASRGSLAGKTDHSFKTTKMPGAGSSPHLTGLSPRQSQESFLTTTNDEWPTPAIINGTTARAPSQSPNGHWPSTKVPVPVGAGRSLRDRSMGTERRRQQFPTQKSSPPSSHGGPRDRAGSDLATHPVGVPRGYFAQHHQPPSGYPPAGYHSHGPPPRKYSPPRQPFNNPFEAVPERSQSALSTHGNSRSGTATGYFDVRGATPVQTNSGRQSPYPSSMSNSPRASPIGPGHAAMYTSQHVESPASAHFPAHSPVAVPSPTMVPAGSLPVSTRLPAIRKRSVNKSEISDPIFVSSTSSVTTIDLPPGASLANGMSPHAPAIPPINPRRRRSPPGAMTMYPNNGNAAHPPATVAPQQHHHLPGVDQAPVYLQGHPDATSFPESLSGKTHLHDDRINFSADDEPRRPRIRTRLRKTSSEGGSIAHRARQHAMMAHEPAMPDWKRSETAGAENANNVGAMF